MGLNDLYNSIVDEVVDNVKEAFLEEGFDEQVLRSLKEAWLRRIHESQQHRPHVIQPNPQHDPSPTQPLPPALQQPQQAQINHQQQMTVQQQPQLINQQQQSSLQQPQIIQQNNHQQQQQQPSVIQNHHSQRRNIPQLDGSNGTSDEDDEMEESDGDFPDDENDVSDEEDRETDTPRDDEDPLNSGDDVSNEEAGEMFDTENVVVCQYDKITRNRNKWKFHLKDGIMNINGRDYVFQKAVGDAECACFEALQLRPMRGLCVEFSICRCARVMQVILPSPAAFSDRRGTSPNLIVPYNDDSDAEKLEPWSASELRNCSTSAQQANGDLLAATAAARRAQSARGLICRDLPVSNERRTRRFSNETTAAVASGQQAQFAEDARVLRIQVTGIHVDKSEFPLSKLLFELTLKLALSEANKFLEQQQQQQAQQRREQVTQSGGALRHAAAAAAPPQATNVARLKVKLTLSVRSANTCSRQYASALAAEEYYVRRARLFIVSGCDDAIRGVSRLATQWRLPIMTAAGFGAELDDKRVHRTLVRVAFSLRAAVEFLFKIMKSYQWRRANLIVDESDPNSLALRGSIEKHMEMGQQWAYSGNQSSGLQQNFTISLNTIVLDLQSLLTSQNSGQNSSQTAPTDDRWPNLMTEKVIRDTLVQCSLYSRVTILLLPQQYLRRLMLSAYDQNMANGMYTFLSMPLLAAGSSSGEESVATAATPGPTQATAGLTTGENAFMWRSPQPKARNAHAKQAFESLMSIYLRTPQTKAYVYFASALNNLAQDKRAREGRGQQQHQLNINPYSASFYDSLQIYARALNESLGREMAAAAAGTNTTRRGRQQQLHTRISELVRSRRFENMVTGRVFINSNGDRETDYTLDDMNQMTGKYAPVILFRGETRDIERLGRIHWSSDPTVGPTSDLVDCALVGMCASKPMTRFTLLLMLLAGPLLFIMSGLFYFVHSRLSLESQLVDYWWKIHLSEIEIISTRRKNLKDGSLVTTGSLVSSSAAGKAHSSFVAAKHEALTLTQGEGEGDPQAGGGGGSVIGFGNGGGCDKTEVTRATMDTATSGGVWASSAVDVCYGNITLGVFKLTKVALKPISKFRQSRKLMIELRNIKEVNQANLCRFKGILVDEGNLAIVSEFCPKGSLREFFQNESMIIDWTFKYSIINDILAGLLYLHSSPLAFHGRLKSSNCLVSGRFVVKLSDYGPHSLYDQVDEQEEEAAGAGEVEDKEVWLKKRIWLAPEHMRSRSATTGTLGSMKGDVYSFGLLLYEIMTNCLPFFSPEKNDYCMPLKSLLQALKTSGPNEELGPDLSLIEQVNGADTSALAICGNGAGNQPPPPGGSTGAQPNSQSAGASGGGGGPVNLQPLVELMKSCWRHEPSKRPSSMEVNTSLKRITRGVTSKKLLENLTSRMEQYTNNLESLVEAKLATLVEEKLKTEELLYQFVPKSIASLLKEGQFVEPEAFECVTVFYSDIVGFTSLSSESSPMEVVGFLSDLYLCFDEILEQHDIFKVDTIGDAYIVASGLPLQNEGKHVIEIACAALELRERLQCFKIPHKPDRSLEMRVGIHSGPCIAGIVGGLNMPKYCVFGDTLTTGKFMESSGLPMKIHITEESRALLAGVQEFHIEPRSPRITKDGLPFQTYWLEKGATSG